MKYRIEIDLDNAAFSAGLAGSEVARILRGLAAQVSQVSEGALVECKIVDVNGNSVGRAEVIDDR